MANMNKKVRNKYGADFTAMGGSTDHSDSATPSQNVQHQSVEQRNSNGT